MLCMLLVVTIAASSPGAYFHPGAWYHHAPKSSLTPPNWVFAPVWLSLYALMAIAAWLVWRRDPQRVSGPLILYFAQLVPNAMWTGFFFGWHQPGWALIDIGVLWLLVVALLVLFYRVSRAAAGLLIPYLAWVSFAAYLNFVFWQLNR